MKKYEQLSLSERCILAELRAAGLGPTEIAVTMKRHRSTIYREVERNRARHDGGYRSVRAQEHAVARRNRSRRNGRFGPAELGRVEELLALQWSPEQVSGYLRRRGELRISHERIYQHIWRDRAAGGELWQSLSRNDSVGNGFMGRGSQLNCSSKAGAETGVFRGDIATRRGAAGRWRTATWGDPGHG